MEDYVKLDGPLAELLPQNSETFSEMLGRIIRGEEVFGPLWIVNTFRSLWQSEVANFKYLFVSLLTLALIAAVFHHFSGAFQNQQIADLSFYFTYLLLINTLLQSFYTALEVASGLIETIVRFMEILLPTYYITIAATSAFSTAAGFYQLTLILIYFFETAFPGFIIPLISAYVYCAVISGLAGDDKLQSMLHFIKKIIDFMLKLAIGGVTGFGVVKSMVNPVIDGLKTTGLQKCISVIPGVGEVTESVSKVILGSAILIKNSMGVAILVCLLSVCILPMLKLLLLAGMMQLCAALMGMFADQRSYRCTKRVGEGCLLLLKAVFCVIAMLFITIAIISSVVIT